MQIQRIIGIYLVLVALVTAIQSVTFPVYGYDADGDLIDAGIAVWHVLNWFMALGLAGLLFTTYREKRRLDGESSPDLRRWVGAGVKFYVAVLVTVAFVPNWVAAIFERGEVGLVWYAINTTLPIIFTLEAIRIRRSSSA